MLQCQGMALPQQRLVAIGKWLLRQARWSYLIANLPLWLHSHSLQAFCAHSHCEHGKELQLQVTEICAS